MVVPISNQYNLTLSRDHTAIMRGIAIVCIAKVSVKIRIWRSVWIYMGGISASIFVSHPIVRHVVLRSCGMLGIDPSSYQPQLVMIYIPLVLITAIAYSYMLKYMSSGCNCRNKRAKP